MKDYLYGVLVGLVIGCIATTLVATTYAYKEGQIDCINGAIYYKLEKQLDGATKWERTTKIVKPE